MRYGRSQRRPERPNPVRRVVVVDERDARGQRNGRPLAHFDCDGNEVFAIGNFSLNLDLQNLTRFRLGVTQSESMVRDIQIAVRTNGHGSRKAQGIARHDYFLMP
jgi:hypothetical protein